MSTNAEPRIAVIVVAAGSGTRLGAELPKAFVRLDGLTLLERSLHAVRGMRQVATPVLVVPCDRVDEASAIAVAVFGRPVSVVPGGATRQQSVAAGLSLLADDVEVVLVHDAARALTTSRLFDEVVEAVDVTGHGVIPGLPVSDTIKRVSADGTVHETVDRSSLAAVQTPQGFPRDELLAAYAAATTEETDDAGLVAAAGFAVTRSRSRRPATSSALSTW
jgi:2-C-methyl-D-erythritol 4-phosphate cytidylyltransferase/2-C-methyl-D-erythritol 2,4-cyclodiphosphate synthase